MAWTAGGTTTSSQALRTTVYPLGERIEATVLKGTPNALALGRRCAQSGYEFHWKPYARAPTFIAPDGMEIEVDVDDHYIPFITNTPTVRPPKVMPIVPAPDGQLGDKTPIAATAPADDSIDDVLLKDLGYKIRRIAEEGDDEEHKAVADTIDLIALLWYRTQATRTRSIGCLRRAPIRRSTSARICRG